MKIKQGNQNVSYTDIVTKLPVYSQWKKANKNSIWKDSIFECFRSINSSRSRGAQGELLQGTGTEMTMSVETAIRDLETALARQVRFSTAS